MLGFLPIISIFCTAKQEMTKVFIGETNKLAMILIYYRKSNKIYQNNWV
ncbi:hypothetical protein [Okeania sp. SIO3B5]|nr:hypothetical protein [Okeania sp. SIO3B5]